MDCQDVVKGCSINRMAGFILNQNGYGNLIGGTTYLNGFS